VRGALHDDRVAGSDEELADRGNVEDCGVGARFDER
jgi:hypothetical protein